MSRRRRKGALLGLVVFCALVLVVLGMGLLFLIMQLGGGQELQHATDAGNLNVAKQVLRSPGTALLIGDELNQFGGLVDPITGQVNLLNINRLVAQVFLVNSNAQALGTTKANTNAGTLMDTLEGISNRLNNELTNSSNFDTPFGNVATTHAMRMFDATNNPVTHLGADYGVSLMIRGAATNVYIQDQRNPLNPDTNQILSGSPLITSSNSTTVSGQPNQYRFLKGYTQLGVQGGDSLWGVPLRPGLPPHLVSQVNFDQDQPRGAIPAFVPPNAFRTAGKTTDRTASFQDTRALSMALVGSLQSQFAGAISRGVIVVDNTGALNGFQFPGGFDIWQDKLMNPNYVEVLGGSASYGLIADQSGGNPTLQDVKNFVASNYNALSNGDVTTQSQLAALLGGIGIDSFGQWPANPTQLSSNMSFIDWVQQKTVAHCDNTNTTTNGEPCNLTKFISTYGEPQNPGTTGTPVANLMAVEKFHIDLCAKRAGGQECGTVLATAQDTGLKYYSRNDCGLTQIRDGTLNELISETSSSSIVPQMITYMHQMKPTASSGEVNAVFTSVVAFNKVSYIYLNPSTNSLVLSLSTPPWLLPDMTQAGSTLPDGTLQIHGSGNFDLNGITNCSGECGYPHPYDCPGGSQATGANTSNWTPCTGFRDILGVLKFINQARGGGQFCCPC